jgi:predicted Rossmann fold flavoprotein
MAMSRRVVIVGGGAAGFFGAITCAENKRSDNVEVLLFERSPHFLSKVRISGGGRCNVTHSCFDVRLLASHYPRGERALIGPFQRFQPRDAITWFEDRGVRLKTENDGRIFPVSDSSQTIIDCLLEASRAAGVVLRANCGVARVKTIEGGIFELTLQDGEKLLCNQLLIASGGCRTAGPAEMANSLGHQLEPPIPSLFTFHLDAGWLRDLAGISVESVEASVPGTGLRETGPILVTHWGVSGPAILRLSAWGARSLNALNYRFPLTIKWLPGRPVDSILEELHTRRESQPTSRVAATPIRPLPARLWAQLALLSGIEEETRWNNLTRSAHRRFAEILARTEFQVVGKSPNKAEFVTCGGVRLKDVDFRTMESRICPGLYFAGEILDIDGITGGFNFQAAWTTGWIAGNAIAKRLSATP